MRSRQNDSERFENEEKVENEGTLSGDVVTNKRPSHIHHLVIGSDALCSLRIPNYSSKSFGPMLIEF